MNAEPMIGHNRTAAGLSPDMTQAMVDAGEEFPPSMLGDETALAGVRINYAEQAEPIGTLPPPPTVKGVAKTALKAMQGKQPTIFLDKLGARLAFERSGTRLWQGLLSKFDAFGSFENGPERADLEHIAEEELAHFKLLTEVIERLGGDPTAMTPAADLEGVASMGVLKLVADPRVNLVQSLEAALIAELTDNDCWEALIELARLAGEDELEEQFATALQHEQEHLANVRNWLAAARGTAASRTPSRPRATGNGVRARRARPAKKSATQRKRTTTQRKRTTKSPRRR